MKIHLLSDLHLSMYPLAKPKTDADVVILECDEWYCAGVRFLGCTLWSDHRLIVDPVARELGLQQALSLVHDFSRIGVSPGSGEKFTPAVSQQLFDRSVAWLDGKFAERHDGPTVVVTHFAPSRGSIHPRFADSPINPCFVSDLESMILRWQPQLWLHGHVHDSFDYSVGRTRVVSNPRGYAPRGLVENASFNPTLTIDLDEGGAAS